MRIFFVLLAMVIAMTLPGHAAKRALVIGNNAHLDLPDLEKAVSDALAYEKVLSELGYSVTLETDLTTAAMQRAIGRFVDEVLPGDEVAFIFAGHGWSDGSTNYIIGADMEAQTSLATLRRAAIPLRNGANGVIDDLQAQGAQIVLSVIDACRNNPFVSKLGRSGSVGLSRGLSLVPAVGGTFTIFSAGAGQEALDRLGDDDTHPNSVFSRVFLRELRTGGSLQDMVLDTAPEVAGLADGVGHLQRPAYYDGIGSRYCLTGTCGRPRDAAATDGFWDDAIEPPATPLPVATLEPDPEPDPYFRPEKIVIPLPKPATALAPTIAASDVDAPIQFIVRSASPIRTVNQLDRESICTVEATPEQATVTRFFASRGLSHNNRRYRNLETALAALQKSRCGGIALPPRLINQAISMVADPTRFVILPEIVR